MKNQGEKKCKYKKTITKLNKKTGTILKLETRELISYIADLTSLFLFSGG